MTEPTLPTQGMSRAKDILPLLPFAKSTLWRKVKVASSPARPIWYKLHCLAKPRYPRLAY